MDTACDLSMAAHAAFAGAWLLDVVGKDSQAVDGALSVATWGH